MEKISWMTTIPHIEKTTMIFDEELDHQQHILALLDFLLQRLLHRVF